MAVYYVLLRLSALWLGLSFTFRRWANAIRSVWLIGTNLYPWLNDIANELLNFVIEWNAFANEWLRFTQSIPQAFSLPAVLNQLIAWADDIISLVRYFDDWVIYAVQRRLPNLSAFLANPAAYVIGLILSHTGLGSDFLYNPRGTVLAIISQALGGASAFLANPLAFIAQSIVTFFPRSVQVLQNPDGWLVDRVQSVFPELQAFLTDPDGYILARIQRAVETRLEMVSSIAQSIATKIIGFIW